MASAVRHNVVVVGAGPAGMAAAASAAEAGGHVLLLDDNPYVGGQIWRGEQQHPASVDATVWRSKLHRDGLEVLCGARVFDAPAAGNLLVEAVTGVRQVSYEKLIFATGARERFLPFPGWTLPNVMGAGGLQAMAKAGLPIQGKRVVVAGTGPLLLAVAAYLHSHGAKVLAIAEQAPQSQLARFALRLVTSPGKLAQAFKLRRQLASVPYLTSCWPVAAHGSNALEAVTLSCKGKLWRIECDYLACGFHLVPNIEMALLLGCKTESGFVAVDEWQQTSVPNVYCAGEPTGIGGVELSIIEGQIAGCAAAGQNEKAAKHFAARRKYATFARGMDRAFQLRDDLRRVPDETLLCRCEDVSHGRVRRHQGWREAKLHTRCGMGPCQGRVCGAAASFLFGWQVESARPPVFPAQVAHLAAAIEDNESVQELA